MYDYANKVKSYRNRCLGLIYFGLQTIEGVTVLQRALEDRKLACVNKYNKNLSQRTVAELNSHI